MASSGTTPTESVVRQAVELACRAPSLHNSQPWLWEFHDGKLYLFADESRILDRTDPSGRQLVISCGAALHHVRVALASASWAPRVHRLPDPERPQLLAVLEFDREHSVHPREATLALAISQRHADRRPFMEPTSLGGTLAALEAAAREEHAYLVILDSDAHADMAKASALSTSIRKYDAAYKAELAWWTGHIAAEQGVPGAALLPADDATKDEIGRQFHSAHGNLKPNHVGPDQATLGVLSTADNTRLDWLRSGEALSAVLLEATAAHLATCPLTHLTELDGSRDIVRAASARAGRTETIPQVVIRFGLREVPRAPDTGRRAIDEVFS